MLQAETPLAPWREPLLICAFALFYSQPIALDQLQILRFENLATRLCWTISVDVVAALHGRCLFLEW